MRKIGAFLAALALVLAPGAQAIDLSRVSFTDDFLGVAFDARWNFVPAGTGKRRLEPLVGGWLKLYTGTAAGTARMRIGEEPGNSLFNVPNWCACRSAVAEAVVFLNTLTGAQATIGFTGINDPQNVGGALLYNPLANDSWVLQTVADGQITNTDTNWTHTAGWTFRARIETSPTEVRAYINGVLVATNTTNIPQGGQTYELQLWNITPFAAGMWVDAVGIEQDR